MSKLLQRIRESRLSLRLLGLILIFSVLLTLLMSAVQLMLEYRRGVTGINNRLANLEASVAPTIANSLWSSDEQQLEIQLRSMLEVPAIEYVEVETTYGERYRVGTPLSGDDSVSRTFELRHVGERVVPLGTVTIQATLQGIQRDLMDRAVVIVAAEAVSTFLIALFILFLFQRMVTRHLATMASFARTMSVDRLGLPLVLHRRARRRWGPDELDQVARAVNEMRRSLQAEIGERQRAEAAYRFLADAGKQLSVSLDLQAVAGQVSRIAVSGLADLAVCYAAQSDGSLWPVSMEGRTPEESHALREALHQQPNALSLAPTCVVVDVTREPDALTAGTEAQRILEALRVRSFVAVPLELHGRRLGLLVLMTRQDGSRTLRPEDATVIDEFGRRASMALDNALLYEESQTAIRLRDEFLTVASHELRTPLMAARLHAHKLKRLGGSELSERELRQRVLNSAAALDRQVERLTQLADSVLDVSQIMAGALKLKRGPVALDQLARDVLNRVAEPLGRAGCEVDLEVDGNAVGWWDPVRLGQVAFSLLSNAMKFGAGQRIEVRVSSSDAMAQLSVRDHGIGIPREDQARIFERFTRAVSDRHFGGLGLGLFVSRKIVEAHGGTIRVESEPGKGATFIVELPSNLPASLGPDRPAPGELLH